MTVFDSRLTPVVRRRTDRNRADKNRPDRNRFDHNRFDQDYASSTPAAQVGWVAALVWPAVATAVVAGALLGAEGRLLLWAGIIGAVGMFVRQGVQVVRRSVRTANLIIDSAPAGR